MQAFFRHLQLSDLYAARALRTTLLTDAPNAFFSTLADDAAQTDDYWSHRMLATKDQFMIGGFIDGALIAQAGASRDPRARARHEARLWGVGVAPDARGRGIGVALMEAVLSELHRMTDVRTVSLSVLDGNSAAITLYERVHFKRVATMPMAVRLEDGQFLADHLYWRTL